MQGSLGSHARREAPRCNHADRRQREHAGTPERAGQDRRASHLQVGTDHAPPQVRPPRSNVVRAAVCRKLQPGDRLRIATFGTQLNDTFMPKLMDKAAISEVDLETQYLTHVNGKQGQTALWGSTWAMLHAMEPLMRRDRDEMFVVLTDGRDSEGGKTAAQVRDELEAHPGLK
jgi:hypothetical protein